MPEPENPLLKDWVNKLSNIVGIPDQNTYLVGHSLGVITILKYLEALPGKQTIGGAVLIAGFSTPIPDMPRELNNFFTGKNILIIKFPRHLGGGFECEEIAC